MCSLAFMGVKQLRLARKEATEGRPSKLNAVYTMYRRSCNKRLMVEWSQGNTLGGTKPRRGLVGKIVKEKKTHIRGHLHGHSAFVPDCWPDTLGLPLVDDFVKDIGRHAGPLQMVADNALYLLIGKGDGMLRQREGIHVRRQGCYGYGGSDLVSISAHALTCASLMSSTTSSRRNWRV